MSNVDVFMLRCWVGWFNPRCVNQVKSIGRITTVDSWDTGAGDKTHRVQPDRSGHEYFKEVATLGSLGTMPQKKTREL